jgi:hypothetical protein
MNERRFPRAHAVERIFARFLSIYSGTDGLYRRSCTMSLTTDRALGKRARRRVSDRLRAYHDAVMRMVEPDSEAFFDRVVARAESERDRFGAGAQQIERAQL